MSKEFSGVGSLREVSLLSLYAANKMDVSPDSKDMVHLGKAEINNERRAYLFMHPPVDVSFELPGAKSKMSFGISILPNVWDEPKLGGVEFAVLIDDVIVFKTIIDPWHLEEHRKWNDFIIDLPDSDGPTKILTLSVRGCENNDWSWAVWSEPLLDYSCDNGKLFPSKTLAKMNYPMLLPKDTRFFFIVGSMKSGTTWLMNALNSHPDICCQGEMHPLEVIDRVDISLPPTLENAIYANDQVRLWYTKENNGWNLPYRSPVEKSKVLSELDIDQARFLFEWSLLRYFMGTNSLVPKFIGEKSPSHTKFIGRKIDKFFGIYRPFVLHIVRDPRDVAVSACFHCRRLQMERSKSLHVFNTPSEADDCALFMKDTKEYLKSNKPFFPTNDFLEDSLYEWTEVNSALMRDGSALFQDRYLVVRYEDLKRSFVSNIETIFQWFGAQSSPELATAIYNLTDPSRMKVPPSVFRKGSSGEWKSYMSQNDLDIFSRIASPVARLYGYE